jgi:hypothetical protein
MLKVYLSQAHAGEHGIIHNTFKPEIMALFASLLHNDSIVPDIGGWIEIIRFFSAS